jgi:hypothetical protein
MSAEKEMLLARPPSPATSPMLPPGKGSLSGVERRDALGGFQITPVLVRCCFFVFGDEELNKKEFAPTTTGSRHGLDRGRTNADEVCTALLRQSARPHETQRESCPSMERKVDDLTCTEKKRGSLGVCWFNGAVSPRSRVVESYFKETKAECLALRFLPRLLTGATSLCSCSSVFLALCVHQHDEIVVVSLVLWGSGC